MAKQCPRCWGKVEPGTETCPNCGYSFNRKAAAPENGGEEPKRRNVVFPKAKKDYSEEDGRDMVYSAIMWALLVWVVLGSIGGIWNLVQGEYFQGAGLLASGIICLASYMLMRKREHHGICWLLVLVSAAATLQIPTLIIGVIVAFLVYSSKPYFDELE